MNEKTSTPQSAQASGSVGISLEHTFLLLYVDSITALRECLKSIDDPEKKFEIFNLLSYFLIKLIPDSTIQERIIKAMDDKETEYKINKKFKGEYDNLYVARLEVLSGAVQYLSSALDIVHTDTVSGLTEEAVLEAYHKLESRVPVEI